MHSAFLHSLLAILGGALGASVSALGGFVLFGFLGIVGYLYLIFGMNESWVVSLFSSELFAPHICFIGGAVAAAYTRKRGTIECGKDIGRSLMAFRSFPLILVGAVAGFVGFWFNFALAKVGHGQFDTVALTVVLIPLLLKYLWGLRKTNDCEGTSHAVPSPYRFFEHLSTSSGKIILLIVLSIVTSIVTMALLLDTYTHRFAGMFMFYLSALSLYLLFFKVPIPVTHQITGPAAMAFVQWVTCNELSLSAVGFLLPMMWGLATASLSIVFTDLGKKFLFDEGDIHVDPPAVGIVFSSAAALWLFPSIGVYSLSMAVQPVLALLITLTAIGISLRFLRDE